MRNRIQEAIVTARHMEESPHTTRRPHHAAGLCLGDLLTTQLLSHRGCMLGYDTWAKTIGANRAHLIIMLREAGAGRDPLGHKPSELPRKKVWENLSNVTELPSLRDADLEYLDLMEADLSNCDLTGAKLSKARMELVNLENSTLRAATMNRVNMVCANLRNADLKDTVLIAADLRDADLTGANLAGAKLRMADLTGTELRHADLTGADLSNATLYAADITGAKLENTVTKDTNFNHATYRDAYHGPLGN